MSDTNKFVAKKGIILKPYDGISQDAILKSDIYGNIVTGATFNNLSNTAHTHITSDISNLSIYNNFLYYYTSSQTNSNFLSANTFNTIINTNGINNNGGVTAVTYYGDGSHLTGLVATLSGLSDVQLNILVTGNTLLYSGGSWKNVNQPWEYINNKPTTISGYGITDAYTITQSNNNFLSANTSFYTQNYINSNFLNLSGGTINGNLTVLSLTATTNSVVLVNSSGTMYASPVQDMYITDITTILNITTSNNWDVSNSYTGPTLSGLTSGQKYLTTNYTYEYVGTVMYRNSAKDVSVSGFTTLTQFYNHTGDTTVHFTKSSILLGDLGNVNTSNTINGYYLSYSSGTWVGVQGSIDMSAYYTSAQTNVNFLSSNTSFYTQSQSNTNFLSANTNLNFVSKTGDTMTGKLDISYGSIGILLGADFGGGYTRTDATQKAARIAIPHYNTGSTPATIIYSTTTTSANVVNIGGGSALMNAATQISFYTATNNTTTGGTEIIRIDSNGLFSNIKANYSLPTTSGTSGQILTMQTGGTSYWTTLSTGTIKDYIYVSPNGSDSTGNGSMGLPYATMDKGVSIATTGQTVYVMSGTYSPQTNCVKDGVNLYFDYNTNVNTTSLTGSTYVFDCTGFIQDVFIDGYANFTASGAKGIFYNPVTTLNIIFNYNKIINTGSGISLNICAVRFTSTFVQNTSSSSGNNFYILSTGIYVLNGYLYNTGTGNVIYIYATNVNIVMNGNLDKTTSQEAVIQYTGYCNFIHNGNSTCAGSMFYGYVPSSTCDFIHNGNYIIGNMLGIANATINGYYNGTFQQSQTYGTVVFNGKTAGTLYASNNMVINGLCGASIYGAAYTTIVVNSAFAGSLNSSNSALCNVILNGGYLAPGGITIYGNVIIKGYIYGYYITVTAGHSLTLENSYVDINVVDGIRLNSASILKLNSGAVINGGISLNNNAILVSNGGVLKSSSYSITTNAYTLTLINYQNLYAVKAVSGTYTRKITGGGDIIIDANVI